MKRQGISLIVLVITIIVMIILAAAIIISLNNTGIIENSNKAVKDTDDKQIREAIEVAKLNLNFEGSLNETTLKNELEKSLGESVEVVKNTDNTYTIKVKDMYYTLEEDETVIKGKYDLWDKTSTSPAKSTNEIHIYKASELKWLEEQVAAGENFEGYTVYLENNLDFGARESEGNTIDTKWKTDANKEYKWTPISKDSEHPFNAKFDGNGHIIKGIYVEDTTTRCSGIFGRGENVICNLTIKNSYIEGMQNVGGIVGRCGVDCEIINCHNVNTTVVLADTGADNYMVGGIAGTVRKSVRNCTNSGTIIANGTIDKAGFANKLSYAGGIVCSLELEGAIVENCANTGKIISKGAIVGGIVSSGSGTIKNCTNRGQVEAGKSNNDWSRCGGVMGSMNPGGQILECSNFGNISGEGTQVGGIVGVLATQNSASNDKVEMCINFGNIKGSYIVGGILGLGGTEENYVKYCYNKGEVTGSSFVGSIMGKQTADAGTFEHLYYLSTLKYKAINNVDNTEKNVVSTTKNINSFDEFKTWIAQFK